MVHLTSMTTQNLSLRMLAEFMIDLNNKGAIQMTTQPIYSIAISAQAILSLHSLNNEGSEGNQSQTRMVNVMDTSRNLHSVNAISGDMFKHIQAEHLHRLALAAKLPLSDGARAFIADRVNSDIEKKSELGTRINEASGQAAKLTEILRGCAVTDLEGTLITTGGQSLPRKGVVEFGWVTGIPEQVATQSYFHVKYANERGEKKAGVDDSGSISGKQTPFHRAASSGAYAIVLNLEMARIGFNDISQSYAIDANDRLKRAKALLESVLFTFVEPAGAMRSTQNPHIVDLQGVIAVSRDIAPAPTISPLNPDFVAQLEKIASAINSLRPNAIEIQPFANMAEFAERLAALVQAPQPYELTFGV
jgi:CRISPR-associated protein Cst2